MTATDLRIERVRTAHQAVQDAVAAQEQAILDALADGTLSVAAVARVGLSASNLTPVEA